MNIQPRQPAGRPIGGQYASPERSEGTVALASPLNLVAPGESVDLPEACDGTVIESLNVLRSDDGERHWIESAKTVDVRDLVSRHLPAGTDPREWLDANEDVLVDYLNGRYEAETTVHDGWDSARIACQGTMDGAPFTAAEAADAAWEQTRTVALHNESDPGTWGSEDLGRLLVEHVGRQKAAADRPLALRHARTVVPAQGAAEHLERAGTLRNPAFPVADALALAAARSVAGDRPALKQLGERGYADARELRSEAAAAGRVPGCAGRAQLVVGWLGGGQAG